MYGRRRDPGNAGATRRPPPISPLKSRERQESRAPQKPNTRYSPSKRWPTEHLAATPRSYNLAPPPRLPPTRRLVGEWRGIRRQEGRISGATEISEILQIANHSHTIPSRGLAARLRPARTLVGARRGAARRKEGSPKSLKSPRFVRLLNPLIPQKSREYWEFPTSQNPVSSHFPPGGWPADYGLPYNPLRPPGYRLPQIRSANGGRGNGGRHNS